jgi:hypothetical protein
MTTESNQPSCKHQSATYTNEENMRESEQIAERRIVSRQGRQGRAERNTDRRGDTLCASRQNFFIIDILVFLDTQFFQVNGLVLAVRILASDHCCLSE